MTIETPFFPDAPPTPMTVREWAELDPDAGLDLVDGRLVRKPEVAIWHDMLLLDLAYYFVAYFKQYPIGRLTGQKSRMRLSNVSGREPDLFFIPKEQYHLVGLNVFTGVPPLVIEILSLFNIDTDRVEKYREYARLGIAEYWIVDFPNRCLEVHRLQSSSDGARYTLAETHRGDATFKPTLFQGLEIPLADIWPTAFENPTAN